VVEAGRLPIHSFRVVFELERRIHKVDRWRIPVPYGVPLRGLAYWAIAMVATIAATRFPVLGGAVRLMPPPIRLVIAPVGIAYLLTRVEVDGRPAHLSLAAWLRLRLAAPHVAAFRDIRAAGSVVRFADVALMPDERSCRYRGAVIEGPATVLLRFPPHGQVRGRRRPALHVRQLPGPPLFDGKQVRLRALQRMVVHG
jgi:hypothetical protein